MAPDVEALVEDGLHEFVDSLQLGLADLHDEVAASYFLPVATGDAVAVG